MAQPPTRGSAPPRMDPEALACPRLAASKGGGARGSGPWGQVGTRDARSALSRTGKAHLKRSILGQEEALRLHAVGRALRTVDLLQAVLAQALRRSLAQYSELDLEDDFLETTEAPDIQREPPGPSRQGCPACGRPWAKARRRRGHPLGGAPGAVLPCSRVSPSPGWESAVARRQVSTGRPPSISGFAGAGRRGWSMGTPRSPQGGGGGNSQAQRVAVCIKPAAPWAVCSAGADPGHGAPKAERPRALGFIPFFVLSAKTQQKPEIRVPSFSRVKVTDIFQRLVSTLCPGHCRPRTPAWVGGGPRTGSDGSPALPSPFATPAL